MKEVHKEAQGGAVSLFHTLLYSDLRNSHMLIPVNDNY